MNQGTLGTYISSVCPQEAPQDLKGALLLAHLSVRYPELAADVILREEFVGNLLNTLNDFFDFFYDVVASLDQEEKEKFCRTLLELCCNLLGTEAKRVGFAEAEIDGALGIITAVLRSCERSENEEDRVALRDAIGNMLERMKQILSGNSMVAKMAENIERALDEKNLAESFVMAFRAEIQGNVYYRMVTRGMGNFGNDSATGLRAVRHLGFVQVSSNPVIAARSYEEDPGLWNAFGDIVEKNPEWQENPEQYADEIALHGTIISLLPNLLVFRPLALLSGFSDGMVSYQLNPHNATDVEATISDAKEICAILQEILYHYDAWLGWDPDEYAGRPNIVFKVAACDKAAIPITERLNTEGIGTNDTVTYSVSQELSLLIAEAEGMARSISAGIMPTQAYQTNMIGRTEDHLREVKAAILLAGLNEGQFEEFSSRIAPDLQGTREERARVLVSKKYLGSLDDPRLLDIFEDDEARLMVQQTEQDIQDSGIYVTRRVYEIFFAAENRSKWMRYVQEKFSLSENEAAFIFDRIDMLPASKRRARDTYLVLGTANVTNTEFPNQQLTVLESSFENGFDLEEYRDSIEVDADPAVLERLLELEDFVRIYEATPLLARTLQEVGIEGNFGRRGMKPEDWHTYGAVRKTMEEFMNAYSDFRQQAVEFVRRDN